MNKGGLALVLHAHLPFVRSAESGSLEEDWFFQALLECYLPLLDILEKAAASKKQKPKITIGISPTLLSLLQDPDLKKRFPNWLEIRLDLLKKVPDQFKNPAIDLRNNFLDQYRQWEKSKGDLIKRFADLQKAEVVDLLTCAATHGYLPLLREHPETVRGQLNTAVKEHTRIFGLPPLGIWLPECAYYEGLDHLMIKAGLRYAVLDGHGLLHASPRPRYGLYAPICTKNGVAFFGRDSDSTLPVWSARDGYPGESSYREFHRDLGWDLQEDELNKLGIKGTRPLGIKLHRVTDQRLPLEAKAIYDPAIAKSLVKKHAKKYLSERHIQLKRIEATINSQALLVAPFDAELFGHWWFEGPAFIRELFKQASSEQVEFTHLKDILNSNSKLQLCNPCPSSWGQGGYHEYWLNDTNAWIVMEWSKAGKAMIHFSSMTGLKKSHLRILEQAARELLLAQSSDWSFILKAGTTIELAKARISRHLERFWKLIEAIDKNTIPSEEFLKKIEEEDSVFPLIDINDWSKKIPL